MPRARVSSTIRSITAFCVVTSRPVVGSSAIRSCGLAGQRQRDHDALAHAAGQLERIGVIALARAGRSDLLQRLDRLLAAVVGAAPARAGAARPRSGRPTLRIGLSAARGFWKIIEISRPRRSRICVLVGGLRTSMPENITEPSAMRAGAVEDAHHGVGGHRFAGAGFADDGRASRPWRRVMLTCCTALHDAAPGGEFDRQVADVEQRDALVMASASRPPLRIDDVAQAVAEQVEAEHRDHQRQARETARSTIRPTP